MAPVATGEPPALLAAGAPRGGVVVAADGVAAVPAVPAVMVGGAALVGMAAAGAGLEPEEQALKPSTTVIAGSVVIQKVVTGTFLAVRPEHMTVSRAADARSGNCLPVTVTDSSYFGATTKVALVTSGGSLLTLTLPTAQSAALQPGSKDLVVTWPFDKGFVLAEEPR